MKNSWPLPRAATVTATSDVRVATLTTWNFRPFVRSHAEVAWAMLQAMARRAAKQRPRVPAR